MITRIASRRLLRFSVHPRRAMSTLNLDPSIFTPTLYKQVSDIWLHDVDLTGQSLDPGCIKRWFAGSPDEKVAFDNICRSKFASALESISPSQWTNPSAEPFLQQLKDVAQTKSDGDAAWTALSMILLLDQMTRNIYRTDDGLRKVYSHYDTLAQSLTQSLLSTSRPDLHPQWRASLAHRMWFFMPLMHSEDIAAHDKLHHLLIELEHEFANLHGVEPSKSILQQLFKSERDHREILEKFGRYPHRNGALGRETADDEKAFLESGGATFGVAQAKGKA